MQSDYSNALGDEHEFFTPSYQALRTEAHDAKVKSKQLLMDLEHAHKMNERQAEHYTARIRDLQMRCTDLKTKLGLQAAVLLDHESLRQEVKQLRLQDTTKTEEIDALKTQVKCLAETNSLQSSRAIEGLIRHIASETYHTGNLHLTIDDEDQNISGVRAYLTEVHAREDLRANYETCAALIDAADLDAPNAKNGSGVGGRGKEKLKLRSWDEVMAEVKFKT